MRSAVFLGASLAALLACFANGLERSRDAALRYYAVEVQEADTSWSYLAPYLARRFGAELRLASGVVLTPQGLRESGAELPTLPVFRRLFLPVAPVTAEDIAAVESPVDRTLAVALHCPQLGLPLDWLGILTQLSDRGGYGLTHAVLASQWSVENGCLGWLDQAPLRARQVEQLVALLGRKEDLVGSDPNAADIWLEALALLHYLGRSDRVEPAWIETLLELQRADGGWPEHPRAERSSPHATAFALWVVLERLQPEATRGAMIPGARNP